MQGPHLYEGSMRLNNSKGVTFVECLISTVLVSTLLIIILGAFIISRLGVDRAKHRMMAMNTIRAYMEQEIKAGYLGGIVTGNYYVSVTSSTPITFTIDDNGTADTGDDLAGTIRAEPYPAETYESGTVPQSCRYKKVGFIVEWVEKQFGGGVMPTCRERAAAYVADHT